MGGRGSGAARTFMDKMKETWPQRDTDVTAPMNYDYRTSRIIINL